MRVVAYIDNTMPIQSSYSYTIEEAVNRITEIRSLYREIGWYDV
jgi:hypothetical protein